MGLPPVPYQHCHLPPSLAAISPSYPWLPTPLIPRCHLRVLCPPGAPFPCVSRSMFHPNTISLSCARMGVKISSIQAGAWPLSSLPSRAVTGRCSRCLVYKVKSSSCLFHLFLIILRWTDGAGEVGRSAQGTVTFIRRRPHFLASLRDVCEREAHMESESWWADLTSCSLQPSQATKV